MDLSDGLAGDLRHILKASGVDAELLKSSVPVSAGGEITSAGKTGCQNPAFAAALTDGEDFELLFTIAAREAVKLLDAWKKKFPGVKLSCIGRIVSGTGLSIRDGRGLRNFEAHGYVHLT